ncbi:MAG: 50S ribosomal protein L13 [Nitrospinaceae bacterium]|jgi:large subunit ribosomal protein L13|nr:50S ribosomal protein L13 [Nitrospinaceae bacterium]MBT3822088.1 50S ribosomal protein L13 [Nitrospinaceae bacterium]MBT4095609.1 50S ribosomal protein L13 [Nitrospinaceae bacterium]MBT4429656.1 50S ribosomal protein L13 [Nitrospinaceae bacterium]MBT5369996.1 50S ribosomal protein L13 [Nitrospinaceae bacterium]
MYQPTKFISKEKAAEEQHWVVIDAEGQTLGRLATKVATLLRGKHRPEWSPHVDCGDYVVIINSEKVFLTGQKAEQKKYFRHSGYIGHMREVTAGRMLEIHPERVVQAAVRGMLPKTKLGRAMFKKLKVYVGASHPHEAQKPEAISLA